LMLWLMVSPLQFDLAVSAVGRSRGSLASVMPRRGLNLKYFADRSEIRG
jgi:hypothetical protein